MDGSPDRDDRPRISFDFRMTMTCSLRRSLILPAIGLILLAGARGTAAQARPPAAPTAAGASEPISAPISNVRYGVTFNSATARVRAIQVSMTFDVTTAAPVLLSLPAWTPGSYEISNFAKNVMEFSARAYRSGSAGDSLTWDKLDHDTWRVQPGTARSITVSFSYYADALDVAASWTANDLAMFNGTNLFLYPEGRSPDYPATVAVTTEADWKVATGMRPAPGAATARTFAAGNYHDLVDMPFMVGQFDLDSMRIADRWTRLATYPARSLAGAQRAEVWRALEKSIPPQVAVFGEAPWDTYTVMQVAHPSFPSASGLEHQNSHLDVISTLAIGHPVMPSLYAHEVFHAWNIKRLRPIELWPYRYDRPQPTTLLWVSEGITDYYADLSLVRGGVSTAETFYETTSGKIQSVDALPPIALEDASLSTWIQPVGGGADIYYNKGSLAGLMLDIMIRDATDNRRSLDDVMRDLYATTYKRGTGFTVAQWWSAVSRAAGGRAFDDFNRRYIDGREAYPWATLLPLAGMRVAADTLRVPRIGVTTAQDSAGIRVMETVPGSAAATAGVREGDYILAVGDIIVEDPNFGEQFRARYATQEGAAIPIRVRRGAETLTLQARVEFAAQIQRRVEEDAGAGAKAARIRNGILRGTVDR
jgi:predicted metalloprotease with PDZ domain